MVQNRYKSVGPAILLYIKGSHLLKGVIYRPGPKRNHILWYNEGEISPEAFRRHALTGLIDGRFRIQIFLQTGLADTIDALASKPE